MKFHSSSTVFWRVLFLIFILLPSYAQGADSGATFRIAGAVERPGDWTAARLEKDFVGRVQLVTYALKERQSTARCVSLLDFVQAARPRLNAKIKHHLLSFMVVVQGRDGYSASFSLGELLPENGKAQAWIAFDQNSESLPPPNGPVQLLVTSDARFARWVHGVARITVIDGTKLGKRNLS